MFGQDIASAVDCRAEWMARQQLGYSLGEEQPAEPTSEQRGCSVKYLPVGAGLLLAQSRDQFSVQPRVDSVLTVH